MPRNAFTDSSMPRIRTGSCGRVTWGVLAVRRNDPDRAREIMGQLRSMDPDVLKGGNNAWRARIAAALGDREEGTRLVEAAFAQGLTRVGDHWRGIEALDLHADPDLSLLRGFPRFDALARPQG